MTQTLLGISGFSYADLHQPERLEQLYQHFCDWLRQRDQDLAQQYLEWMDGKELEGRDESALMLAVAPHVSRFIAELFLLQDECDNKSSEAKDSFDTVFAFRQKITLQLDKHYKKVTGETPEEPDDATLRNAMLAMLAAMKSLHPEDGDSERLFSQLGLLLLEGGADAARIGSMLDKSLFPTGDVAELFRLLILWCRRATGNPDFAPESKGWVCLKTAQRTDSKDLVPHHEHADDAGYRLLQAPLGEERQREGFALTDQRFGLRRTLYEVDHCIYCHERSTDSCSRGMPNRKSGGFKLNGLGNNITGCPLDERISEMNFMKRQGDNIAALALVMVDNPMCPGTGHRICNDCMKGCIYQKTEPVNIPQIESNTLTEVLFMPWGFEIYGLLCRFNPLNRKRPYTLPYNGRNVLIAGLGPAGYTLAHYLVNEGFAVVGVDGLKIEPLDDALTGHRGTDAPQPVKDFRELYMELDQRPVNGFGGVAEYGITSRWDKNFLTVIYLSLARRANFRCYGNVRFGGTVTVNEAWELGFDHIAMATGAGKPTMIGMQGNMVRGVRMASDFLMALQLGGAARESSLANLQLRLPVGVIGGGLTGIDATTEALAYYPVQVEKILRRWETLCQQNDESKLREGMDQEELAILDEFLRHAKAIREERRLATEQARPPNITRLLQEWGGATMFYRKNLEASPAYRLNHEEVREALAEGISIADNMTPQATVTDEHGALAAVRFGHSKDGQEEKLEVPLRSLFIAAGTRPNIIYEQEHPYTFRMHGKWFQHYEPELDQHGGYAREQDKIKLQASDDGDIVKLSAPAPFTSYNKNGRTISFYGDMHPVYAGSVVKAMASARDGYPYIVKLFADDLAAQEPAKQGERQEKMQGLFKILDDNWLATVEKVERLGPNIVNVVTKAPAQARAFSPGQFYRVQNYSAYAETSHGTELAAEGMALTGAAVDKGNGTISLITLEMEGSSRLCSHWRPGTPIAVMGVTGQPTEITADQTIIMVGGGLGNAVLFSIGRALRDAGGKVLYFAGYRERSGVFRMDDIEKAADVVVWAVDSGQEMIQPRRPQDKSFSGNIVQAMLAYASGKLGAASIDMQQAKRMLVIGSDRMMAAVKHARHAELKPYLDPEHIAIGSINSPMQCMMKGVCAQCLCRHINQDTGEENFVYSCYNQDQKLDVVDFDHLNARLRQNSLQEKITGRWLDLILPPQDS